MINERNNYLVNLLVDPSRRFSPHSVNSSQSNVFTFLTSRIHFDVQIYHVGCISFDLNAPHRESISQLNVGFFFKLFCHVSCALFQDAELECKQINSERKLHNARIVRMYIWCSLLRSARSLAVRSYGHIYPHLAATRLKLSKAFSSWLLQQTFK